MYIYLIFLLAMPSLVSAFSNNDDKPLETVSKVDLNRYAGKWYEIARLPNSFQEKCAGEVSAEYKQLADGKIEVVNRCRKKDGTETVARGTARVTDKETNAKLKVRFAPGFLSFLPFVWGDYWIIDLDGDYQYAVVGAPDRKYLWVLSRTPEMDEARYQELIKRIAEKGFETDKIIKTRQKL